MKKRTVSMAMTACEAKVSNNATCLSENGLTSVRRMLITPIAVPFPQQRRHKKSSNTASYGGGCPGTSSPPPEGLECELSCAGQGLVANQVPCRQASRPGSLGGRVPKCRRQEHLIAFDAGE